MEPDNARPARAMENMPVVDLTGLRSREAAAGLRLKNIGAVLVPEDLPDLLAEAECTNVGAVVPLPQGTRVDQRMGQVEMPGDALAAGDERTILMLIGQVVVTPEVQSVGYRGVILVGQVLLPKSAQGPLATKIINQTGQILYYEGGNPRVFFEDVRITRGFLELLEDHTTLLLVGDSTFAADVPAALLRQRVQSIALLGDATVEAPTLQPLVQFLARPAVGSVKVAAGDGGEDGEGS